MDERAKKEGICGVTHTVWVIEWICIRQVHGAVYERRSSDRHHPRGGTIFSTTPNSEMHYFVPKWPNREKE